MGSNPSKFQEGWSAGLRPVESITYEEVTQFLEILNSEPSSYLGLNGTWRLPTEAEWEYAAKAGTITRWSFGNKDSELDAHGWHAGNSGATTREVGSKKANQWGFFDMHGLIHEMTSDQWNKDHSEHHRGQTQRTGPNPEYRVAKGGSWFTESDSSRSSSRRKFDIHKGRDGIGIRLVWEPTEMKS
jgi:formylglycine-generating enzyme required for sulfatase activity